MPTYGPSLGMAMVAYLACSDTSGDPDYEHPSLVDFDWYIQIQLAPTSLEVPPDFDDDGGDPHIADGAHYGAGPSNASGH